MGFRQWELYSTVLNLKMILPKAGLAVLFALSFPYLFGQLHFLSRCCIIRVNLQSYKQSYYSQTYIDNTI